MINNSKSFLKQEKLRMFRRNKKEKRRKKKKLL